MRNGYIQFDIEVVLHMSSKWRNADATNGQIDAGDINLWQFFHIHGIGST